MANLTLVAPLRGWARRWTKCPTRSSPAAAGRRRRDRPDGESLHAPCDGEVISIAPSSHAVTLRADNGAEMLLHVGIDTVALGGEGFEAHVAAGERVRTGDPLLRFDLDVVARGAKSLITPIVITNGERFAVANAGTAQAVDVGDAMFECSCGRRAAGATRAAGRRKHPLRGDRRHAHGLHARPAALSPTSRSAARGDRGPRARPQANARSAVSLDVARRRAATSFVPRRARMRRRRSTR